ncbi:MAG: cyclic nucleotide-binding domain-containing protein [Trueperaceae bacterium]|nr:cyclic nucleotide-binding domain-containing protein [Trueperaceae bacterium]
MNQIKTMFAQHPLFQDFSEEELEFLATCASAEQLDAGRILFQEAQEARHFYLIREGDIALELRHPKRGVITIQTLHAGDALGWSWLFPPYSWHFDARAMSHVHLLAFDAEKVRERLEQDNSLGYRLMKRFASLMLERLQATRLQVLDLYGTPS